MRVNIYIRKEDERVWKKIENKPDWLHRALSGNPMIRDYRRSSPSVEIIRNDTSIPIDKSYSARRKR